MKKGQMVAWCAADNSAASFVSAHKLMLIRRSCVQNKSIPHCKIYGITLPSHLPTWPNISQSTRTYPAQEMKIIRLCTLMFQTECTKRNIAVEDESKWNPVEKRARDCPITINGLYPGVFQKLKARLGCRSRRGFLQLSDPNNMLCRFSSFSLRLKQ